MCSDQATYESSQHKCERALRLAAMQSASSHQSLRKSWRKHCIETQLLHYRQQIRNRVQKNIRALLSCALSLSMLWVRQPQSTSDC
eukprot:5900220-Amphidinium_carterae.1